ncbi:unnamed protein product [Schistosoma rodhaini]|nr:unnamed protein product [Schistosoma rodhaini]
MFPLQPLISPSHLSCIIHRPKFRVRIHKTSLNLLITHYANPRIRGISGDDKKEVLRKLQLLCRYDSEKQLQTNGNKQLGRHYTN